MNTTGIVLTLTLITTALIAGLYYAYSCSVNPGLGRLPDAGYIAAMQSINLAIQNPVFFISFFGTLVLLPLSAYLSYGALPAARFYCLLAAAAVYAIGSFGVTLIGNVPLNNALAAFDLKGADDAAIKAARLAFEGPWNRLHLIRTIAALLALVLAVLNTISLSTKS